MRSRSGLRFRGARRAFHVGLSACARPPQARRCSSIRIAHIVTGPRCHMETPRGCRNSNIGRRSTKEKSSVRQSSLSMGWSCKPMNIFASKGCTPCSRSTGTHTNAAFCTPCRRICIARSSCANLNIRYSRQGDMSDTQSALALSRTLALSPLSLSLSLFLSVSLSLSRSLALSLSRSLAQDPL